MQSTFVSEVPNVIYSFTFLHSRVILLVGKDSLNHEQLLSQGCCAFEGTLHISNKSPLVE